MVVGEEYLRAVMFEQVRLLSAEANDKVRRLVSEISSFQNDGEMACQDLMEKYKRLPEMEYAKIERVAELIREVVQYVVDLELKRMNDRQVFEWRVRNLMANLLYGVVDPKIREVQE